MQSERDFEALNKLDDEDDSDFSDEEVTPQEEDLQVVLDRVIEHLKEHKSSRPKLKSTLLQLISTMNTVVSYVSVVDVIDVLAAQGFISVSNKKDSITFHAHALQNPNMDKLTTYIMNKSKLFERKKQDLIRTVRRVLLWMKDNSELSTNYHMFCHSLTTFCGASHRVSEDEVFQELIADGYLTLRVNDAELSPLAVQGDTEIIYKDKLNQLFEDRRKRLIQCRRIKFCLTFVLLSVFVAVIAILLS